MSSSRIIRNLEQEPLLEDFDDQGQDLEVVVQREPLLHERLDSLLQDLHEAERQVRVREKKPISRFRIYSAACIGVALTAIAAPGVLARFLVDNVYPSLDRLQKQAEQQVQELERLQSENENVGFKIEAQGVPYREQLFGFLKPHYEAWWSHTECNRMVGWKPHEVNLTTMNWLSRGGQFFCSFKEFLPTDDFPSHQQVEICYPIAVAGCEETEKHVNLTQPLSAIDEAAQTYFMKRNDYWYAEQTIKGRIMDGFSDEAFNFANGGWQITLTSISAASILGFALYKLVTECRGYRARMAMANVLQLVSALPPELAQSDEFKDLTQRAGVTLEDNKALTDLSGEMQEVFEATRLRHERRQMFFRGALPKNSGTALHGFFHSCGGNTRDIQALILERADLLQVKHGTNNRHHG